MSEDACILFLKSAIALGVAFAAFCIWLGVRIVNRRERWAKQVAIILAAVILIGYPLSFGPAFSVIILSRPHHDAEKSERIAGMFWSIYRPIGYFWRKGDGPINDVLDWYVDLCD